MPIVSNWGNPQKTIIVVTFTGDWTLEEYHSMIDSTQKLMISVEHTVHFISDFTASTASPVKLLSAGRHTENSKTRENDGINVSIKASGFIKAISGVFQKLFLKDTQIYFANTMEEAYEMIAKRDSTAGK